MLSISTTTGSNNTAQSSTPGFVGCYAPGGVATTGNYLFYLSAMTSDICRLACQYKGFSHAALTGTNCYCATGTDQVGTIQAPRCVPRKFDWESPYRYAKSFANQQMCGKQYSKLRRGFKHSCGALHYRRNPPKHIRQADGLQRVLQRQR